jgi:hypothetical protein
LGGGAFSIGGSMTFVSHRYRLGEEAPDRAGFLPTVIPADVLLAVLRADDIEHAAQARGEALVQSMRAAAETELTKRMRSAEEAVWSRAIEISNAFEQWQSEFTEQIGRRLASIIKAYLETLALEMPEEAKTLAALGHLIRQVGPVLDARLLVPASSFDSVATMKLPGGWTAEPSEQLQSGECRLVLTQGEWSVSFDGMLMHFISALQLIEPSAEETLPESSGTG